ncbi:MAG: tripartite tricarboxylate transporter substrate binding protein [Pseudomonadota bacterium]
MKFESRRFLVIAFIASCLAAGGGLQNAHAQTAFPSSPVTMVVPYPPGGGTDFFARTVAVKMGEKLGQSVIVENKPGAATAIGALDVARAKPDGLRILLGDTATFAANSSIYKKLPYDTLRDFTPISLTGRFTLVLVTNPQVLPYNSVAELVAAARKAPGTINYATSGAGNPFHLATAMFERSAGISLTHVPYKGAGPAVQDLLGGQIGMMFLDYATARAQLASGKLKALAVASPTPHPSLPGVPTIAASYPGFEAWAWQGLVAPTGTPRPAMTRLREAYFAAINDPLVRQKIVDAGIEPLQSSGEQMDTYVRSEIAKWSKLVTEANIHLD